VCDATHVNSAVDLHAGFDNLTPEKARNQPPPGTASLGLLALNPVDLFRAANLEAQLQVHTPALALVLSTALWLAGAFGFSFWQLRRNDL